MPRAMRAYSMPEPRGPTCVRVAATAERYTRNAGMGVHIRPDRAAHGVEQGAIQSEAQAWADAGDRVDIASTIENHDAGRVVPWMLAPDQVASIPITLPDLCGRRWHN